MSINKLDIKYNNPVMDSENIEKIANTVNDIIDAGTGTVVEANPDDDATEALTKLLVDDTVYSIPEGVKLYMHIIETTVNLGGSCNIVFNVITPESAKMNSYALLYTGVSKYGGAGGGGFRNYKPLCEPILTETTTTADNDTTTKLTLYTGIRCNQNSFELMGCSISFVNGVYSTFEKQTSKSSVSASSTIYDTVIELKETA